MTSPWSAAWSVAWLSKLRSGWRATLVLAVLIDAWELYVDLGGADPLILPAPHAVAKALYSDGRCCGATSS